MSKIGSQLGLKKRLEGNSTLLNDGNPPETPRLLLWSIINEEQFFNPQAHPRSEQNKKIIELAQAIIFSQ